MVEDCIAFELGHATHHAHEQISFIRPRRTHFTDARVDLSLSFLANRTGVQQHDVGVVDRLAEVVARSAQPCGGTLRISHIHLAAKRLDVHSRLHSSQPN
jgi:hypothetical protein